MSVSSLPPQKIAFLDHLRGALALRRLEVTGQTSLSALEDAFEEAEDWFRDRGPGSKEALDDHATFRGVEEWDDVIALQRGGQTKRLEEMVEVLDRLPELRVEARAHRKALQQARTGVTEPLEKSMTSFFERLDAYVATRAWEDVVPSGLQPWPKTRQRLGRLLLSDEEKESERSDLAPDEKTKQKELQVFTQALEGHSLVALGRFDPFDPQLAESVPVEDLQKMQEVIDTATRRAEAIRDLGGTPAEVEAAFGDIPKQWWPPRFVDELQAWRRTERQVKKEALLKARYTDNEWFSVKEGLEALKAVLLYAGTMAGNVASVSGNVGKLEGGSSAPVAYTGEAFAKDLTKFVTGYAGSLEAAGKLGEQLAKQQPKDWDLQHIHQTLDSIAKAMATLGTVVNQGIALGDAIIKQVTQAADASKSPFAQMIEKSTSLSGSQAGCIVPGLGLGIAILKLANAIRALVEQRQWRFKTLGMQEEERGRRSNRDTDWDSWARGGNLERALGQEVDQREHLTSIEALAVTAAAFDVTAGAVGVAKASGLGAPIAAALEIGILLTKTAVEVGGKVVIANIEFSKMDAARKTLADARAGSMVAQQLIFLQSAFYAKMYIAILAKDNDPLAGRFLIDRGYTGPDLEREDVAVSVLRDFLMSHARDKNPHGEDAPQSRLGAMTDALIPGGELVRKTVARKQRHEQAKTKHSKVYDESWTHPTPLLLQRSWWQTAKTSAVEAGLVDVSSGIGGALKAVEDAAAPLQPASFSAQHLLAAIQGSQGAITNPTEERKALLKLRSALGEAAGTVTDWDPLTNPPAPDEDSDPPGVGPHKGMAAALAALALALQQQLQGVETQLKARTFCEPDWAPGIPSDYLATATWTTVWPQAQQHLALDPEDAGITAAVSALGDARLDLSSKETVVKQAILAGEQPKVKDVQKLRGARLTLLDRADKLARALLRAPASWRAFAGWAGFIEEMQTAVATLSRKIDAEAAPSDWQPPGEESGVRFERVPEGKLLDPSTWSRIHQGASRDGVVSTEDHDVGDKLTEWASAAQAIQQAAGKPLALREARLEGRKVLVALSDAVTKFSEEERATLPPAYLRYCADIINKANKTVQELRKAMQEVAVTPMTKALTQSAWTTFHTAASTAGIINPSSTAGKLGEAIGKYETQLGKVLSAPNREAGRSAADKAVESTSDIIKRASELRAKVGDGYGEHPAMTGALDWIIEAAGAVATEVPAIKSIYGGEIGEEAQRAFQDLRPAQLSTASWGSFGRLAREQGLLDKSSAEAIGKAIEKAVSARTDFEKKQKDPKRFETLQDALKRVALPVRKLGASPAASTEAVKGYLGELGTAVETAWSTAMEAHKQALKEALSN